MAQHKETIMKNKAVKACFLEKETADINSSITGNRAQDRALIFIKTYLNSVPRELRHAAVHCAAYAVASYGEDCVEQKVLGVMKNDTRPEIVNLYQGPIRGGRIRNRAQRAEPLL